MTDLIPIRRALLSVSDKTGLEPLARALAARGVELVSTGGTARELRTLGLRVTDVAHVTSFPEMLDGRVKTLHPHVHGALLARRGCAEHMEAIAARGITPIELVVVNLYPFEDARAAVRPRPEMIETIDIGGPAMLRSAAKNHEAVAVLSDPAQYDALLAEIAEHDGATTAALRIRLAAAAFAHTAAYDSAIAGWLAFDDAYTHPFGPDALAATPFPQRLPLAFELAQRLRYGENPHQEGALYTGALTGGGGIAGADQIQGKHLSYNNIADADAALELIAEFRDGPPTIAIVKHANPCGVATGSTLADAYARALSCDPVSAFGGIVAANRPLDRAAAESITAVFTEVVLAPDADADARAVFATKKNLRLLLTGPLPDPARPGVALRSVGGGLLVQARDAPPPLALRIVTRRTPTPAEDADMRLAWTVARHVRSNAVVYAKDGMTAGIGAGQMNRRDSARIAATRAADAAIAAGLPQPLTVGSAVASDAFFPFADGLIEAARAGATAVIQPGGSVRDAEVIAAADAAGLTMAFTGVRHFRH